MRIKGAEKKRQEILEEFIGNTQKRAFLVEGESDQLAFSMMLDKKFGSQWGETVGGRTHQQTLEERRNQLFSGLPLPEDLEFLWEKIELY